MNFSEKQKRLDVKKLLTESTIIGLDWNDFGTGINRIYLEARDGSMLILSGNQEEQPPENYCVEVFDAGKLERVA
jgi:hypothetical protein